MNKNRIIYKDEKYIYLEYISDNIDDEYFRKTLLENDNFVIQRTYYITSESIIEISQDLALTVIIKIGE